MIWRVLGLAHRLWICLFPEAWSPVRGSRVVYSRRFLAKFLAHRRPIVTP